MKIESLLKKIKKLEFLAYYDELTRVYNRRGFFNEGEKIFKTLSYQRKISQERRRIYKIPLSVIVLDVDNFKSINDTFGHQCGDLVLSRLAKVLKKELRKSDIIGRIGGEEFSILLIGCNIDSAYEVAERLRKKVEKVNVKFKNKNIKFTISLGVASYEKEETLKELINNADKAMYRAKREGKNRTIILNKN